MSLRERTEVHGESSPGDGSPYLEVMVIPRPDSGFVAATRKWRGRQAPGPSFLCPPRRPCNQARSLLRPGCRSGEGNRGRRCVAVVAGRIVPVLRTHRRPDGARGGQGKDRGEDEAELAGRRRNPTTVAVLVAAASFTTTTRNLPPLLRALRSDAGEVRVSLRVLGPWLLAAPTPTVRRSRGLRPCGLLTVSLKVHAS